LPESVRRLIEMNWKCIYSLSLDFCHWLNFNPLSGKLVRDYLDKKSN
jgi:hypothetical protein